ncbi:MAG: N-acetylmuramoyl-L-alanine amidase [Chitinivibrionia bacterium]|nr:N-acetylmuramoyl-L-alanine amidase [Chitinivibrionia bacterium]
MKHRLTCTVLGIAVLLTIGTSCAPPPQPRIDRIYTGLQERLPRFDPTVLAGRAIVIDPGHGGAFRGTRGPNDLEEAAVNLGVALYLGGLLLESGASVHYTRSADRDYLVPADSSLSYDLEHRIAVVDSVHPDIFVSIHHNARSDRSPDVNAIETYYKFGDHASRDLAFAVHRHLVRNLGIKDGVIKPGNYHVLRSVDIPAILGEASYLTNPEVEGKLQFSAKQKLEAEAYYLGILDYFRRGTPKIRLIAPAETTLAAVPDIVYEAEDIGGTGVDPDAIFMEVNGKPVHALFNRELRRIQYGFPWNAPNGRYTVSLHIRNLMGNSSAAQTSSFAMSFPPEQAVFDNEPAAPPWGWGPVRARGVLLDRRGLSVAEGSTVRMTVSEGRLSPRAPEQEARVQDGYAEFCISPETNPESVDVVVECAGKTFNHTFKRQSHPPAAPAAVCEHLLVLNRLERVPVPGACAETGDSIIASASRSGVLCLPVRAESDSVTVRKAGYRPAGLRGGTDTLFLDPWFRGALHGKRFVLDPQGGGASTAGAGPLGLYASYVNVLVARLCASYLRLAGSNVLLTRSGEETVAPHDVVAMANGFDADRYIEIRHHHQAPGEGACNPASGSTYFFPGSVMGKRMAESLAGGLARGCGAPESASGEQVTYPLQQTACPAVVVEFPSIETPEEELRLGESWYLRQQAYALFLGILGHFSAGAEDDLAVLIETAEEDKANWLVTLDGTWNVITPPSGRVRFGAIDAGSHTVSVRKRETAAVRRMDIRPGGPREIVIPVSHSNP